ncbi:hypothetical protein AVEN_251729-1, partial [Araneus ventricosus]
GQRKDETLPSRNIWKEIVSSKILRTAKSIGSQIQIWQNKKQQEGYFEIDLFILNRRQMTGKTPELVLPSPTGPIHGGSLVESGFEPGALRL